ncbi:MAG: archaetidylserine decarboxylase [Pseudohongiellaceae bacterium]
MPDRLFILLQYLTPQHLLSRAVGRLARCRLRWISQPFIRWFIRRYGVDMAEADAQDPGAYPDFITFFTRPLRAGIRPLEGDESVAVCPADGQLSQSGRIRDEELLQAKGRTFTLAALLGDREAAERFRNGRFATLYLSPRDYHRVHMPLGGTLTSMRYIPGRLFSVNQTTAQHVPGLFARNERVVCHFDTEAGPMALVLVGAMIVAGVETVWAGEVCPATRRPFVEDYHQHSPAIHIERGGEMGRFKLGSTVIVLFGQDAVELTPEPGPGDGVRVGQALGHTVAARSAD